MTAKQDAWMVAAIVTFLVAAIVTTSTAQPRNGQDSLSHSGLVPLASMQESGDIAGARDPTNRPMRAPEVSCPWDCEPVPNNDVGINDFLALLGQWFTAGSCDFDGGGVGINDFLGLLANWGPCP